MSNAHETQSDQPLPQSGDQLGVKPGESAADESAEQPLDLAAQLEKANADYLRAKAEIENVLKRTRREIEEERRYAALPVMRELLAVVDNIHRAVDAAQKDENSSGLLEGVKLVAVQLEGILERHGCKPIKALGEPFDPHLHEAIGQESSDEMPASHVSREFQTGYELHDRVIRPSQVFVSTGPSAEDADQN